MSRTVRRSKSLQKVKVIATLRYVGRGHLGFVLYLCPSVGRRKVCLDILTGPCTTPPRISTKFPLSSFKKDCTLFISTVSQLLLGPNWGVFVYDKTLTFENLFGTEVTINERSPEYREVNPRNRVKLSVED